MTDFEKMIKTLKDSGRVEGEGYVVIPYRGNKIITIYKQVPTYCGNYEEIEFNLEYDLDGNLKEIW